MPNSPLKIVAIAKPSVNVLTLAVPAFDDIDAEVWFAVLELELTNRNINTDEAKFSQLVPRLPKGMLMLIKHILLDPKSSTKYDDVKEIVLKEVRPTERARLEQLCSKIHLGTKKPSVLLREMQQLAGASYIHESLLKELWLQRLPDYTQALLAASPARNLDELAASADSVHERLPLAQFQGFPSPSTSQQCQNCCSVATKDEEIKVLRMALERLTVTPEQHHNEDLSSTLAAIRQAVQNVRPHRPFRQRSISKPRMTRQRTPSTGRSGLCWYHWRYRDEAQNCRPPCTYRPAQGN